MRKALGWDTGLPDSIAVVRTSHSYNIGVNFSPYGITTLKYITGL
jgi:hypothetical protein